ncbi:DUF3072 domain-containing protein [Blastococcus sp. TML/C7B]|uniref:DUF3072 domain-containing protein n=1 Tax=Blastococcus sp. TML/C7B TaxID=2798728 RepID=UPI00190E2795|nr:DUF3072 domain-containing protein [Blastococcus sp. TML/C7B]MBN1095792.1 DUF3072 domain-containing protein [Blastococcus sp. TML/C7B]
MSESQQQSDPTAEKDPSTWVTGDEPATGAQKSYLETLSRSTDEDVETENLTKAEGLGEDRRAEELRPAGRRGQASNL